MRLTRRRALTVAVAAGWSLLAACLGLGLLALCIVAGLIGAVGW